MSLLLHPHSLQSSNFSIWRISLYLILFLQQLHLNRISQFPATHLSFINIIVLDGFPELNAANWGWVQEQHNNCFSWQNYISIKAVKQAINTVYSRWATVLAYVKLVCSKFNVSFNWIASQ